MKTGRLLNAPARIVFLVGSIQISWYGETPSATENPRQFLRVISKLIYYNWFWWIYFNSIRFWPSLFSITMMHKGPPRAMDCALVPTRLFQVTESWKWLWCRWCLIFIRSLILFSIKHPLLNQAILDKLVHIIHLWLCPIRAGQTAATAVFNNSPATHIAAARMSVTWLKLCCIS